MASGGIPAFLGPLIRISVPRPIASFFGIQSSQAGRSLQRPFQLEKQRLSEWCWAAVGAAVRRHRGGTALSQCQVATRMWDGYDCCADPNGCNSPAALQDTLSQLGHLRDPRYEPIDIDAIDTEIKANRPVCCGLVKGGAGHFVVISGWYPSGGETFLQIQDPTFGGGNRAVEYRKLLQGYRDAYWADTYLLS